jgi:hypothetical protein
MAEHSMCQPGKHQRCKLINQRSLTLLKTFSWPNQNMCTLNFLNEVLGFYLVFLFPKVNPSWVLQPWRPSKEQSRSLLVSLLACPRKRSNHPRLLGELSVMNKIFCDYNMSILVRYLQGIAGLDCWIAQSGLQSSLVDWIVNPVLAFQSKNNQISYQETKKFMANLAQAIKPSYFLSIFPWQLKSWLIKKYVSWEFHV